MEMSDVDEKLFICIKYKPEILLLFKLNFFRQNFVRII